MHNCYLAKFINKGVIPLNMSGNAEKLYGKLKEKYGILPDFKNLDLEFEISSVKERDINEKYFSRMIRRRMYEKFYSFSSGLLSILTPQTPSIILAHEHKFLTNEDRDKIMDVIKKLIRMEREYLILETEFDEKKDVEFITSGLETWFGVKPTIKDIITIMRDSWSKKESFKVEDYFG